MHADTDKFTELYLMQKHACMRIGHAHTCNLQNTYKNRFD
jgi:hypothetical protein